MICLAPRTQRQQLAHLPYNALMGLWVRCALRDGDYLLRMAVYVYLRVRLFHRF